MIKGYLATHFFNEAGFEWTEKIAHRIRTETSLDLYVPQENGEINDKTDDTNIDDIAIAKGDNDYLRESQILIASLDGVEIDSGVSAEIGYLSGYSEAEHKFSPLPKRRLIIGLYTDIRRDGNGDNRFYINLYTKGLARLNGKVVHSVDEVIEVINDFINKEKYENNIGGKI